MASRYDEIMDRAKGEAAKPRLVPPPRPSAPNGGYGKIDRVPRATAGAPARKAISNSAAVFANRRKDEGTLGLKRGRRAGYQGD